MSEAVFLLLFLLEFFMGSMMFSYWLGKIKGKDIRQTRDRNPGGSNLGRAFGWKWGMAGIVLDFLKGYVPLVFIVESGILKDWRLAIVSVAPVLGHAFSPFLKFSGGKAVAVTFGIWSALTKWEVPVLLGTIFTIFSLSRAIGKKGKTTPAEDAARVVIGMLAVLVYVLLRGIPYLLPVWVMNMAILFYRHLEDIKAILVNNASKRNVR
jgi:acyl-phosphate glycerol 3-phosphate acyltransferase